MRIFAPFLFLFLISGSISVAVAEQNRRPQDVLISFDGAHHNVQWKRALALGEKTGARFTFFLSCTFLLSADTKHTYISPHQGRGASNVGFARNGDEVFERLNHILAAHNHGHEIASHACGHFDGKDWQQKDWVKELTSFSTILRDAWTINGFGQAPEGWAEITENITGFRAPYLSTSPALFKALKSSGYRYDASTVSRDNEASFESDGLMYLPLPMIPEGPEGRRIIAMDYNWFVRHSAAMENPSRSEEFESRAFAALMASFEEQYSGERKPVQAGFHFTLMNAGAYWRALERFAQTVCGLPDARCQPLRNHVENQMRDSAFQTPLN